MSEKENIINKIRLLIRETIEHSLTKYMEPKDFFSSKDATGLLTFDFIKHLIEHPDVLDTIGEKFTYAEEVFKNGWAKCVVKGDKKGYITIFKDSENVSGYQILFVEVEDSLWENFNKFLMNLTTVNKIPYYQLFKN